MMLLHRYFWDPWTQGTARIGIGLWLEYSLSKRADIQTFLFDEKSNKKDPNQIKMKASGILTKVLKSETFAEGVLDFSQSRPLGSHIIQKYGTTKARQSGCPKDDVNYRA